MLFGSSLLLLSAFLPVVLNFEHFPKPTLSTHSARNLKFSDESWNEVNDFVKKLGFDDSFIASIKKSKLDDVNSQLFASLSNLNNSYKFYRKHRTLFPPLKTIALTGLKRNGVVLTKEYLYLWGKLFKSHRNNQAFNLNEQEKRLLINSLLWFGISFEDDNQTKFKHFVEGVVFLENWITNFIKTHLQSLVKKSDQAKPTTSQKPKIPLLDKKEVIKIQKEFDKNKLFPTDLNFIKSWGFTVDQILELTAIFNDNSIKIFKAFSHIFSVLKKQGGLELIKLFTSQRPEDQIFRKILNIFVLSRLPLPIDGQRSAQLTKKLAKLPKTKWTPTNFAKLKNFLSITNQGINQNTSWRLAQAIDKLFEIYKPEGNTFVSKVTSRVSTSINARLKKGVVDTIGNVVDIFGDLLRRKPKPRPAKPSLNDVEAYRNLWAQLKLLTLVVPQRIKEFEFADIKFNLEMFRGAAADNLFYQNLELNQKKELAKLKYFDANQNRWRDFASQEGGLIWKFLQKSYKKVYEFIQQRWETLAILQIEKLGSSKLTVFDFLQSVKPNHLSLLDWKEIPQFLQQKKRYTRSFALLFEELDKIAQFSEKQLTVLFKESTRHYTRFLKQSRLFFGNFLNPKVVTDQVLEPLLKKLEIDLISNPDTSFDQIIDGSASPLEHQDYLRDWAQFFNYWRKTLEKDLSLRDTVQRKYLFGFLLFAAWRDLVVDLRSENPFLEQLLTTLFVFFPHFEYHDLDIFYANTRHLMKRMDRNFPAVPFFQRTKQHFQRWSLPQKRAFVKKVINTFHGFLAKISTPALNQPQKLFNYVSSDQSSPQFFFNVNSKRIPVGKYGNWEDLETRILQFGSWYSRPHATENGKPFYTIDVFYKFAFADFVTALRKLSTTSDPKFVLTNFSKYDPVFKDFAQRQRFLRLLWFFHFYQQSLFAQVSQKVVAKLNPYWLKLRQLVPWVKQLKTLLPNLDWKKLPTFLQSQHFRDQDFTTFEEFSKQLAPSTVKLIFQLFLANVSPQQLEQDLNTFLIDSQLETLWNNLNKFAGLSYHSPNNLFAQLLANLQRVGINYLPLTADVKLDLTRFDRLWEESTCQNTFCFTSFEKLSWSSKQELAKLLLLPTIKDYVSFLTQVKSVWFKSFLQFINDLKTQPRLVEQLPNDHFFRPFLTFAKSFLASDLTFLNLDAKTTDAFLQQSNWETKRRYFLTHQKLIGLYSRWIAFNDLLKREFSVSWEQVRLYLKTFASLKIALAPVDKTINLNDWKQSVTIDQVTDLEIELLFKLDRIKKQSLTLKQTLQQHILDHLLSLSWSALAPSLTTLKSLLTSDLEQAFYQELINLLLSRKLGELQQLKTIVDLLATKNAFDLTYSNQRISLPRVLQDLQPQTLLNLDANAKWQLLTVAINVETIIKTLIAQVSDNYGDFFQQLQPFKKLLTFFPEMSLRHDKEKALFALFVENKPVATIKEFKTTQFIAFLKLLIDEKVLFADLEQKSRFLASLKRIFFILSSQLSQKRFDHDWIKQFLTAFPWVSQYLGRWNNLDYRGIKTAIFALLESYFASHWKLLKKYWTLLKASGIITDEHAIVLANGETFNLDLFHQDKQLFSFTDLNYAALLQLQKLNQQQEPSFRQNLAQKLEKRLGPILKIVKPFIFELKKRTIYQLNLNPSLPQQEQFLTLQAEKMDLMPLFVQDLEAPLIDFSASSLAQLNKMYHLQDEVDLSQLLTQQLARDPNPFERKIGQKVSAKVKIIASTLGGIVIISVFGTIIWWTKKFYYSR